MVLPFLKESRWPKIREDEDRVVNPSYDTKIQDSLMDELMKALESKDAKAFREALQALIEHIKAEPNEG